MNLSKINIMSNTRYKLVVLILKVGGKIQKIYLLFILP